MNSVIDGYICDFRRLAWGGELTALLRYGQQGRTLNQASSSPESALLSRDSGLP